MWQKLILIFGGKKKSLFLDQYYLHRKKKARDFYACYCVNHKASKRLVPLPEISAVSNSIAWVWSESERSKRILFVLHVHY